MRDGSCVLALALLAVVLAAGPACAHEFWVEPGTFTPSPGNRVPVRLFVGDAGQRDEIPRRRDHLLRFEAIRPGRTWPILGKWGRAPAGLFLPDAEGTVILAYQGRHTFIELPAEKFESYLVNEGLSRVIAERVRRNESLAPGRESYARYAKSLVTVRGLAEGSSEGFDQEVGFPIEFIPETDPRAWRSGDVLSVRLLYEGHPLADQQIKLIHLVDRDLSQVFRTDADGRASLRPPQAGPWLIASVFMRRASDELEGDWESFWASLTFELSDEGRR